MMQISTLFLDIGGVLLTNGWDRAARKKLAGQFELDLAEMEERHHLTFDAYEEGKLSLAEYLERTVFYENRPFTVERFIHKMLEQSRPYDEMIHWLRDLKSHFRIKIAVISNEGKELVAYRIQNFGLKDFVDFFIVSSFVHLRKPDPDIYRLALDIAQAPVQETVYIEDRLLFVEVARQLRIPSIHHRDLKSTQEALTQLGNLKK